MQNNNEKFSSKILLFGEYTIITGSRGLALPFDKFSAAFQKENGSEAVQSAFRLDEFLNYLQSSEILSESMDLARFKNDIEAGIYLKSNIPQGHGIGSSGALCAAIYARYARNFERKGSYSNRELGRLKDIMALMENFYHGTSSGLDCLVSLINKPILVHGRNSYEITEFPDLNKVGQFYLYDSGLSRKTAAFVYGFLQKYETENAYKQKIDDYGQLVNELINDVRGGNKETFKNRFYELSHFQYLNFSEMIPQAVKELWMIGLETKKYLLKLCGAGGGGFFLVYSDDPDYIKSCPYISIK